MRRIDRCDFSPLEVAVACCSTIADQARKTRITDNIGKIVQASIDYAIAAEAGELDSFASTRYDPLGTATTSDFEWLYETRLVQSNPGRKYYLSMRDSNDERCALCNVRTSTTLDHHLPKSLNAVLAVTPDNLLPACETCNHIKLASTIATLNSYFDDLGSGPWLRARILEQTPYVPDFYLDPQPSWGADLEGRAQAHFEMFGLRRLYASQANRQLAGIRGLLRDLDRKIGPPAVQQYLSDSAISFSLAEPNGWETAVYQAAASSEFFWSGGYDY